MSQSETKENKKQLNAKILKFAKENSDKEVEHSPLFGLTNHKLSHTSIMYNFLRAVGVKSLAKKGVSVYEMVYGELIKLPEYSEHKPFSCKTDKIMFTKSQEEFIQTFVSENVEQIVNWHKHKENKILTEKDLVKKSKVARSPKKTYDFYKTKEWLSLRMQALELHGAVCQCCGATRKTGAILHVDHIKPRSLYPNLEFEINNLQILCSDCNLGKSNKYETDWR